MAGLAHGKPDRLVRIRRAQDELLGLTALQGEHHGDSTGLRGLRDVDCERGRAGDHNAVAGLLLSGLTEIQAEGVPAHSPLRPRRRGAASEEVRAS